MPEWNSMSIYEAPAGVDSIWTKAGLTAIRNFESKAIADENFKKTCIADPAPGGGVDTVVCNLQKSVYSPLGLFDDPSQIDSMTEA